MTTHTMFPKNWDEARIRFEVTSAWERKIIVGNRWEGVTNSGIILVLGFLTPNRTAYPVYGN